VKKMKRALYTACKNFSINRVLLEYFKKFYEPMFKTEKLLSADNYTFLRKLEKERQILTENWDKIKILKFTTNIESEVIWEESELIVSVEVELGNLTPELIKVELVCIRETSFDEVEKTKDIDFQLMELEKFEQPKAFYTLRSPLYGHGLRKLGVRLIPANEIIRKAYPEMIKWY
ncbi:MAG: hypothetical protein ACK4UR_06230, partial [Caldimicrobium sp.]